MTFIQPNKDSNFLNKALAILIACLVLGAFWLVIIDNNFVNFEHGLSGMKSEFKDVQAKNVELKKKILNLVDSSNLEKFVSNNLVQDKNPEYFEINQKWSYASQY